MEFLCCTVRARMITRARATPPAACQACQCSRCRLLVPPSQGRQKSSERREYEELREALARKQEEVRKLQSQVARLDSRPTATPESAEREGAIVKIQSVHRGALSRRALQHDPDDLDDLDYEVENGQYDDEQTDQLPRRELTYQ